MPPDLTIRPVALRDAPAISAVHRGSDGPWVDPVECALFVNHRLLRPFHCFVAERGSDIVGHAEWLVSREPDLPAPLLYLGMLQVRGDSQRQGVGRDLVEHGLDLARNRGCALIRTVPDEGAEGFYARCGFSSPEKARSFRLPVNPAPLPAGWKKARSVPVPVPRRLPMRLGWVQACSAHMWEIANRHCATAGDTMRHPCAARGDRQAYAQLRYWEPSHALAIAWAGPEVPLDELVQACLHLASAHSIASLLLALRDSEAGSALASAEPAGETPFLTRSLA